MHVFHGRTPRPRCKTVCLINGTPNIKTTATHLHSCSNTSADRSSGAPKAIHNRASSSLTIWVVPAAWDAHPKIVGLHPPYKARRNPKSSDEHPRGPESPKPSKLSLPSEAAPKRHCTSCLSSITKGMAQLCRAESYSLYVYLWPRHARLQHEITNQTS